ncbi:hypothetical protein RFI_09525 [Reticulomyxa filosa]|uniref:Uncharacterized protein n=1 Tax=Reticulomyxa filosa TaxID=46433 RepID=X6NNM5_RETFI|nr:hypothetical protein RFI_09525 [Reticulomyxa filosa]|eukprot:ETO27606.1 hypothetical protein RFI_09525 [Reticulomyxa filosa]
MEMYMLSIVKFNAKESMSILQHNYLLQIMPLSLHLHHDIFVQIQDLEAKAEYQSNVYMFRSAIVFLQKALRLAIDNFGSRHPYVGDLYNNLGNAHQSNREYEKAIECYEQALRVYLHTLGTIHSHIGNTYYNFGNTYFNQEYYDKAIQYHGFALKIRKKLLGIVNRDVGDSCWNLGLAFKRKGENQSALTCYEEAWKVYNVVLGEWNEETLQAKVQVRSLK